MSTPASVEPLTSAPHDRLVLLFDDSSFTLDNWDTAPWVFGRHGECAGRPGWFDPEGYPLRPRGWLRLPEVPT